MNVEMMAATCISLRSSQRQTTLMPPHLLQSCLQLPSSSLNGLLSFHPLDPLALLMTKFTGGTEKENRFPLSSEKQSRINRWGLLGLKADICK